MGVLYSDCSVPSSSSSMVIRARQKQVTAEHVSSHSGVSCAYLLEDRRGLDHQDAGSWTNVRGKSELGGKKLNNFI